MIQSFNFALSMHVLKSYEIFVWKEKEIVMIALKADINTILGYKNRYTHIRSNIYRLTVICPHKKKIK